MQGLTESAFGVICVSDFGRSNPKTGHMLHFESNHLSAQNSFSRQEMNIPGKCAIGTVVAMYVNHDETQEHSKTLQHQGRFHLCPAADQTGDESSF